MRQEDSGVHAKAFMDAVKTEAAIQTLDALVEVLERWEEITEEQREVHGLLRAVVIATELKRTLQKSGWQGCKKRNGVSHE